MKKLIVIIFVLFLLSSIDHRLSTTYAAIPHLINYQGRLTDKNNAPLNGLYNLTFRIYDSESAGTLLWQGTYSNIAINKGIFSILLGDVNDSGFNFDTLAFDKPYWLEIKVGDEVMSPRQRITNAGYAIRSGVAELALQANNADTLANIGVSAAPAANKLLPLDANAKLPFSALALKTYDSGWFPVSSGTAYTKSHNLGTTKVIVMLYLSDTPDGSGRVTGGLYGYVHDHSRSTCLTGLTATTLTIRTGSYTIFDQVDSSGNAWYAFSNAYARIIMLALE